MLRVLTAIASAAGLAATLAAQAPTADAFKLGTFRQQGRTFAGAVVRDALVVDLAAADAGSPGDLNQLIAQYDNGVRARVQAAVTAAMKTPRPASVYDLTALAVQPPVVPRVILNATLNYEEHAAELRANPGVVAGVSAADVQTNVKQPGSIAGVWTRKPTDRRHNPYFFVKPTTAMIGHGDSIRIPPGRDQIDGECELVVVVGKEARRVPVERAGEYIFGYTIENDVSDRRGRQDDRHGSDWMVAKGFDTFAPIGPAIVPKAFVPDPQKLAIKLSLNQRVMQNSNTSGMTHTVFELLSFASHVITLKPGDLIDTGSPAGVGASTGLFFKPGDVSTCAIEGVGTLRNPVAAAAP